jgi:hypothetical protein
LWSFDSKVEQPSAGGVKVSIGEPADRSPYAAGQPGRPALLGIDWGHFSDKAAVRDPNGGPSPDKLYVEQNRGLAGIVPAWQITELLQAEEVDEMRKNQREELERELRGSETTLDSAGEVDPPGSLNDPRT